MLSPGGTGTRLWVGWEPAEFRGAQAAPWLTGKAVVEA